MEQIRREAQQSMAVLKARREREMEELRAEREEKRKAFEAQELLYQTSFAAKLIASQEALKELKAERATMYSEAREAERRLRASSSRDELKEDLVVEELE